MTPYLTLDNDAKLKHGSDYYTDIDYVTLGFKLISYLMPSTRHTQACVFIKNNSPKLVLFHLRPLEIVDQDREPSEKLGSQIKEQV